MKIVYSIHGYGRGHAMRSMAVLPSLAKNHDVLVLAGAEAYDSIVGEYEIDRIPVLRFIHKKNGQISPVRNLIHNTGAVLDAWGKGPLTEMIRAKLREFKADVLISDSEPFALSAARAENIPTIMFDHYGLLMYCRLNMPPYDRLIVNYETWWYKKIYGPTDRIIASGFFTGPAKRDGVKVVGPVIRDEVRATTPTRGDHMVVYIAQGEKEFLPNIQEALTSLDINVHLYGTERRGHLKNIIFKPISNLAFIEDLASCRAVLASTGNQLCGELIYFKKPLLGMPMDCVEQRLNANQIVKLGIGMKSDRRKITGSTIKDFLAREDEFVSNMPESKVDGGEQAAEALEQYIQELTSSKKERQSVEAL